MNTLLNHDLINNDLLLYYLIPCTICLISGFFIKSIFYPTDIKSPNSPETFNFTHQQLEEINEIMDRGDQLDQQTQDKLDEDFKNILGEEDYNNLNQQIKGIQNELENTLKDLFDSFIS
jgi:hypothetical protein